MKKLFAAGEKKFSSWPPVLYFYKLLYKKVVQREIKLAGINRNDTVLNIGCGAIPFTALHLAEISGARVIGIDKDPEAAVKAKECVVKFALDTKVQIFHGDGTVDLPQGCTVAVVALQVADKKAVFDKLKTVLPKDAGILFRLPLVHYQEEYGILDLDEFPAGKAFHNMKTFRETVLYIA